MSGSAVRPPRFVVPEVVQTSAMDCGPAALKCFLEGFGISVSYARLREACQTDVDGTSIDTLEEVAAQLGLDAEQVMLPLDHLLLPEAGALPALVVTRLASGVTHFVVAWRRHGGFVQVMDPGTGRRWPTCARFLEEVFVHAFPVAAAGWRDWAGSQDFLAPLRRRLAVVGASASAESRLVDLGLADPGWRTLAALDAAARMTDSMVQARGVRRGDPARRVLDAFFERVRQEPDEAMRIIPEAFWSVQPTSAGEDGEARLLLRGAVVVRVRGPQAMAGVAAETSETAPARLSPELVAALEERPARPWHALWRALRADGRLAPAAVAAGLAVAAAGVLFEAVLFRGLIDVGRDLAIAGQRLAAMGILLAFLAGLMLLETPIAAAALRLGRHLEVRLRIALLEKVPRLGDLYYRSRIRSDMAERSHSLHTLRSLPEIGTQVVRSAFELVLTTAGIIWLDPASAAIALLAATVAVGLPLLAHPVLVERDLRFRTHAGALSRFYLDGLLGLLPIRTHGAERAVRREHEHLLVEWGSAGLRLQRAAMVAQGLQHAAGFGLAAWLLFAHLSRSGTAGGALLLVYWALELPVLGQELARFLRQYPTQRNVMLRLLEPLDAAEETGVQLETEPLAAGERDEAARGVAVVLEDVWVRAAGHTILEGIDFDIAPGSHVAIVGASGAGKSSLVGLLLGWHRAASGRVLVDGAPLEGAALARMRRETAWVDPAVQLWNRSFLDNLRYGAPGDGEAPLAAVIEAAELRDVLEKLPDGLQTSLGEGGALVSGGEGQRVRLGRAMQRKNARLVILDEPFRGLDRERRRELLRRARKWWGGATLLCITHDVAETQSFDRVLVMESGRIVEDAAPAALARHTDSRYRAMLEAELSVRQGLWASTVWRRLTLAGGRLSDDSIEVPAP